MKNKLLALCEGFTLRQKICTNANTKKAGKATLLGSDIIAIVLDVQDDDQYEELKHYRVVTSCGNIGWIMVRFNDYRVTELL